jgi:signal transduction histidine kinase/CheY-like chemotaxis protein
VLRELSSKGVDWFVPEAVADDAEIARRARLLVVICATVVVWGPLYAVLFLASGMLSLAAAALCSTVAIASAPLVLRASGSVVLAGNVLAGALFLVVSVYSVVMGGLLSRGALWHPVFAIAGFAIAGRRSGITWTALAIGELSALYTVEKLGIVSLPNVPATTALEIAFASDVGLVLVVLTFTLVFESEKNHALGALRSANRRLAEARDAAQAASEAKTRFLANMSHEIRTPMNGVLGMSELLLQRPLAEPDRQQVGTIHRSARALQLLLDDILDLSKLEAGRVEVERLPCEPRELVREVLDLLRQPAAEKGLGLESVIDSDVPRAVRMDPLRVRQLLLNLVGNALKFTERGEIQVRVAAREAGTGPLVLRFEIEDTGIGIDGEALDTIFESFTQADASTTRRFGGTGLGLAICRSLVAQMDGEIGVESELGRGSTFWFELPAEQAGSLPPEHAPAAEPAQLEGRILLAEDNRVNQELGVAMLERLGLQVDVARDGVEALAAVCSRAYDLVLTDCQMPRMDGYELARHIRSLESSEGARARVPIVALTASATLAERESCLAVGMDDHLAKPLALADLASTLGRWLRDREAP